MIGEAVNVDRLFSAAPKEKEKDVYDDIPFKLAPYDHQRKIVNETVRDLLSTGYHGLFMEMGTGKTKCTIDSSMALVYGEEITGLVVIAPKAILSVWTEEELPKHMGLPYVTYTWDGKASNKAEEAFGRFNSSPSFAVFVVNVEAFQMVNDTMRKRLHAFIKAHRCLAAVDESSFIKSPGAKRSKALIGLSKLVPYRMILTGTEITNSPLDLYMQMRFLCHTFWGSLVFLYFRNRYAILIDEYGAGGKIHKKVVGFQRMDELMGKIAPHVSRALKRDCLDLPAQIYSVIHVDLSPAQEAVYFSLKKHLAAMIEEKVMTVPNKISLFTKFRQITGGGVNIEDEHAVIDPNPPKLQALLADLAGTDEQAIIWAAFTHEIDMLVRSLAEIAPTVAFHGDVPQERRDANKRAFQEGKARFIVMNPQAAAYGLNFQNCHVQYTYSRVLSPAQVWQAESRTHRSGQVEACVYKVLVARGTVDERIEALLAQKTDIRERFQTMTIEDIFNLV